MPVKKRLVFSIYSDLLFLLFFSLPFALVQSHAQTLGDSRIWFTDSDGAGRIAGMDLDGEKFFIDKVYPSDYKTNGSRPSSVIVGDDGVIYGTLDGGFLFKMNSDGTEYQIIHGVPGFIDGNGLLKSNDGNLYGMTTSGKIYKAVPGTFDVEIIYSFDDPDNGKFPVGSLVQDESGILYGVCRFGGLGTIFPPESPGPSPPNQAGVLFKINTDGTGFAKLFDFTFTEGYNPFDLIMGSNGQIFGTASFGGSFNRGVLFTINTDGTGYTKLYEFLTGGVNPRGSIVEYNDKLFGLSTPGFLYSIDMDGENFSVLYSFNNGLPDEGLQPVEITLDEGDIYGINIGGGTNGIGTVFRIDVDGNNYEDIHQFEGVNGNPQKNASFDRGRSLVKVPSGDLIVSVSGGAISNNGILFKLNSIYEATTIRDYPVDSSFPDQLVSLSDKIVGLNTGFGTSGYGGFFTISLTGTDYQEKSSLTDEALSYFVKDDGNDIYVITFSNKLLKYVENTNTLIELYQTDTDTEGVLYSPPVPVDDKLYGSTDRSIYGINKDGGSFTVLKEFDYSDGMFPPAWLLHHNGFLYGIASQGGQLAKGIIYRMRLDGSEFEVLKDFEDFYSIQENVFFIASDDRLYGLGYSGVEYPYSILYSLNLDGSDLKIVKNFEDTGVGKNISMIVEHNDWLIGRTTSEGANDMGAFFRMKLDGTELNKILDADASGFSLLVSEKINQTINFSQIPSRVLSEDPIVLAATSDQSIPIVFETEDTDKVSFVNGNTVTMLKPGRVTVIAKVNNPYYKPSPVSQSFCINPPKPSISVSGTGADLIFTSSSSLGNQWFKDGELIPDAINSTYPAITEGAYTLQITIDDCQSVVSDEEVIVITGKTEKVNSNVNAYPNPVNEVLVVNLSQFQRDVQISIIKSDGKEVQRLTSRGGAELKIITENLNSGVYIMTLSDGNKMSQYRFVKE